MAAVRVEQESQARQGCLPQVPGILLVIGPWREGVFGRRPCPGAVILKSGSIAVADCMPAPWRRDSAGRGRGLPRLLVEPRFWERRLGSFLRLQQLWGLPRSSTVALSWAASS